MQRPIPLTEALRFPRTGTMARGSKSFEVTLSWLGSLYVGLARSDEPGPLLQRRLELCERNTHGEDRPDSLTTPATLHRLFCPQTVLARPKPLFERASKEGAACGAEHRARSMTSATDRYTKPVPRSLWRGRGPGGARFESQGACARTPKHPDALRLNVGALYRLRPLDDPARSSPRFEARDAFHMSISRRSAASIISRLFLGRGPLRRGQPLMMRAGQGCKRALSDRPPKPSPHLATLPRSIRIGATGPKPSAPDKRRRSKRARARPGPAPDPRSASPGWPNCPVLASTEQAEPLLKHVLEVRERVLSPDRPETVASVSSLAALLWPEALWRGRSACAARVETKERTLRPDHLQRFDCQPVGRALFPAGDPVRAAQFGRRGTASAAARAAPRRQIGQALPGTKRVRQVKRAGSSCASSKPPVPRKPRAKSRTPSWRARCRGRAIGVRLGGANRSRT